MAVIEYRYAVVSWCPDLTDPDGASVPVALLMVGTSGEDHFAAIVAAVIQGTLDPMTSAILRDVPSLLKRQLDEIIARHAVAPDHVIEQLTQSLRGSLNVSMISPRMTLAVGDAEPMIDVVRAARRHFGDELKSIRGERPEPKPTPEANPGLHAAAPDRTRWIDRVRLSNVGPMQMWALERLRQQQVAPR